MREHPVAELLEALGAVLVVAGLALWSLPVSLVTAGLFLMVVANAPGGRPPAAPSAGQDGRRAEPKKPNPVMPGW